MRDYPLNVFECIFKGRSIILYRKDIILQVLTWKMTMSFVYFKDLQEFMPEVAFQMTFDLNSDLGNR